MLALFLIYSSNAISNWFFFVNLGLLDVIGSASFMTQWILYFETLITHAHLFFFLLINQSRRQTILRTLSTNAVHIRDKLLKHQYMWHRQNCSELLLFLNRIGSFTFTLKYVPTYLSHNNYIISPDLCKDLRRNSLRFMLDSGYNSC